MKRSVRMLSLLLLGTAAGAACAGVSVNGVDVASGSGKGWVYERPVVRLTGPGSFVVSGVDTEGTAVLRAEADCDVVMSNLVLSAKATGRRARADGLAIAYSAATDGGGNWVACFSDGLWHRHDGANAFDIQVPSDPAAAVGDRFLQSDGWTRSNVSWTPSGTNFAAVVWAGSRFVAARFRGGLAVSEDGGRTWNSASWDGNPINLRAIARGGADGGTLVAASTRGLWTSGDGGLSWTQSTNLYANAVVWADGLFVAGGELRGAAPEGLYWSQDGLRWTAHGYSALTALNGLQMLVAGGGGRFLAGNASGWHAFVFPESGAPSEASTTSSGTKHALAAGGGRYVTSSGTNTGLRWSEDGLAWTRSDKKDGTFLSIVWRNGTFFAEGVDAQNEYTGLWTSADGERWTPVADEWSEGLPALDCGARTVKLAITGTGNGLAGGLYAPAVRIAPGGTLDVSAHGSGPAVLEAVGGRYAAALGGGMEESSGAFVQRGATLFAEGGLGAPDVGPGAGGAAGGGATILGGSLRPGGNGFVPAPSNGVEVVRCVVVEGLAPGEAAALANLPDEYGTDGVVADGDGRVWLWLPASEESFRFLAGGALRRVAAGGGACLAETLPDPRVESASFSAGADGAMEVTLRVSSPVEAEALAPAYSSDLSTLVSGGGEALAPTRVKAVAEDEYEFTFRLPDADDAGFLVLRAR